MKPDTPHRGDLVTTGCVVRFGFSTGPVGPLFVVLRVLQCTGAPAVLELMDLQRSVIFTEIFGLRYSTYPSSISVVVRFQDCI